MKLINSNHSLILTFPLVLLLYLFIAWPGLYGPFQFDDFPNLENLKLINSSISKSSLSSYIQSFPGDPGRPISALSFLINDNAWPSEPFSFKYSNLLLHLLNGVLLFGLIRQLAKISPDLPQNIIWPLVAMTAWLFHPLQISAQMLVVQRMTLLSATFCFAGLWCYIALLDKAKGTFDSFLAISALGTFTVLAFLSKENGALLPLIAYTLNITLLQNLLRTKNIQSQFIIRYSCAIPSAFVVVTIIHIGLQPDAYAIREFNLFERLMTQSHVLLDYIQQILAPQLSGSGIYHDDYPISRSLLNPISTLIYSLTIFACIALALIFRRRFVLMSFAILWFFAAHAMESTVLPLELYFEHRNYIPLFGPILALTALPFQLHQYKKITFTLLASWLVLLIMITSLQTPVWGNQAKMAIMWATENPKSVRANQELSRYYFESNQKQKALETLLSAAKGNRNIIDYPLNSLLLICNGVSSNSKIDILNSVNSTLNSNRFSPAVLSILAELRSSVQRNQCNHLFNQEQWWELSGKLLQNNMYGRNGGKFIHIERAKLRLYQKKFSDAMYELEKAYYIEPDIELSQKMAEILLLGGLNDEAIIWLERGLSLDESYFDRMLGSRKLKSQELIEEIKINSNRYFKANMKKTSK